MKKEMKKELKKKWKRTKKNQKELKYNKITMINLDDVIDFLICRVTKTCVICYANH